MAIILAYDISAHQTEVKNYLMQELGYLDRVTATADDGTTGFIHLPDTTLYHGYRTARQAYADVTSVASSFGAVLKREVAYHISDAINGYGFMSN